MPLEDALSLSEAFADRLHDTNPHVDAIVAIANGAFVVGKIVAARYNLPLTVVRARRSGSRIKRKLKAIKDFLHIPSSLVMFGPLRILWGIFQKAHDNIEEHAEFFSVDVSGKTVLLVDDCVISGKSLIYVKDKLLAAGAKRVITAALCFFDSHGKMDAPLFEPDYFLHRTFHFYPWANHSPYWNEYETWLQKEGLELWL